MKVTIISIERYTQEIELRGDGYTVETVLSPTGSSKVDYAVSINGLISYGDVVVSNYEAKNFDKIHDTLLGRLSNKKDIY